MPSTGETTWTVVGPDLLPVEAVESFVSYMDARRLSPNTVKTYCHGLALYVRVLDTADLSWERVRLSDIADFVIWLRRPAPNVIPLTAEVSRRQPRTVNKILAAVSAFYGYQVRNGCDVADSLVVWRHVANRGYRPFLQHVSKSKPVRTSVLRLKEDHRLPKTLTPDQVQLLLDATTHLRDRFLLALLYETGMRIGQALGLRHEDVRTWQGEIAIVPRSDNANSARAKTHREHIVHVSTELGRLYSDYMHVEYGDLDSDYVFVNLWGGERGHPLTYPAVMGLVRRLRTKTGVAFHPHMLRHTHATEFLRATGRIDITAKRLTHQSSQTTEAYYDHLDDNDLRLEVERFWA
ncbi:MAG: tyrosine-type recombinase/integrase, partial [Mycobacteriales bacterium]